MLHYLKEHEQVAVKIKFRYSVFTRLIWIDQSSLKRLMTFVSRTQNNECRTNVLNTHMVEGNILHSRILKCEFKQTPKTEINGF